MHPYYTTLPLSYVLLRRSVVIRRASGVVCAPLPSLLAQEDPQSAGPGPGAAGYTVRGVPARHASGGAHCHPGGGAPRRAGREGARHRIHAAVPVPLLSFGACSEAPPE
eukprot:1184265-Prorocentrum_minimum.AAC.2